MYRSASLAAFLVCACSGAAGRDGTTGAAGATPVEPATPAATPPVAAPDGPVKPTAPPHPDAPVFELPPVTWNAQSPATLGGREVTAVPCKLERGRGPEPYSGNPWRSSQVVIQAGKLYLLDTAGKLRRYDNVAPDGCELRLDPSFGKDGILDSGEVGEERIDDMAVDQTGTIYLSGWRTKTLRRLADGGIEAVCPISMKSVHAEPGSPLLVMNAERITIADGQCQTHPVRYGGLPEQRAAYALPFGLDLVAVRNPDGKFSLSLHRADGKLKARMAQKGEQGRLCHVKRVSPCAAGMCVLDNNCRSITAWTTKGAHVGVIELLPLLGLDNPWPKDIAVADGESYLVVHQRGPGDGDYIVLFRVLGLR